MQGYLNLKAYGEFDARPAVGRQRVADLRDLAGNADVHVKGDSPLARIAMIRHTVCTPPWRHQTRMKVRDDLEFPNGGRNGRLLTRCLAVAEVAKAGVARRHELARFQ